MSLVWGQWNMIMSNRHCCFPDGQEGDTWQEDETHYFVPYSKQLSLFSLRSSCNHLQPAKDVLSPSALAKGKPVTEHGAGKVVDPGYSADILVNPPTIVKCTHPWSRLEVG